MRNLTSQFAILMMFSLLSSGCAEVRIGPQTETRYTMVHAGKPMQALENQQIKGRVLGGSGDPVEQDVGGWVMMPSDHWDAVERKLETVK